MTKSKSSIIKNLIYFILIVSVIIVLIGTQYVWVPGVSVRVTRYVNLENQYNNSIVMIINDTNRYSRTPFRFNLNTNEKIENKKIDTGEGSMNPYYAINIQVYDNSSIGNESSLLDEKHYIMELDSKNEQLRNKEQINLEYYITILPNGTINFDIKGTREFKWSET